MLSLSVRQPWGDEETLTDSVSINTSCPGETISNVKDSKSRRTPPRAEKRPTKGNIHEKI